MRLHDSKSGSGWKDIIVVRHCYHHLPGAFVKRCSQFIKWLLSPTSLRSGFACMTFQWCYQCWTSRVRLLMDFFLRAVWNCYWRRKWMGAGAALNSIWHSVVHGVEWKLSSPILGMFYFFFAFVLRYPVIAPLHITAQWKVIKVNFKLNWFLIPATFWELWSFYDTGLGPWRSFRESERMESFAFGKLNNSTLAVNSRSFSISADGRSEENY